MISINGKVKNNKVDAEIDDYGDLSTIEVGGWNWSAKVHKRKNEKEIEREDYQYTGLKQLGPSFPDTYTRDELLKFEFHNNTLFKSPIFGVVVTVLAVVIDVICYILLIEQNTTEANELSFIDYLPAVGAAIAIDVLPVFFAQNLHRVKKSREQVIKVFSRLCLGLLIVFIVAMLVYRFFGVLKISGTYQELTWALLLSFIPLSTTFTCFIVTYISYDPIKKRMIELKKEELFVQENIFELEALLEEEKTIPNFKENLISQDDALYDSAVDLIETIGEYYKSYIRTEIIPKLSSPADTTDLTVDRKAVSTKKIKLPIYEGEKG